MSMWAGIFAAGATLAQGLLQQRQTDETNAINIQNNELDRQAAMDRLNASLAVQREGLANNLAAANISAGAQKDIAGANIQGRVLEQQGQAGNDLMLAQYNSFANKPERLQAGVNTLVGALRRG